MSLLAARNIVKRYGTKTVLDSVSIAIDPKERIGLIGANGSGKSTLLSILQGKTEPDDGEVLRRRDLTIAAVDQFPDLDESATIAQMMMRPLAAHQAVTEDLGKVERAMATASGDALNELIERQADLTQLMLHAGGYNVQHVADAAMDALSLPPKDRVVGSLSLGERRRLALAMGLIEPHDLLILDEPTNHLDVAAVGWLEKTLEAYPGAVLLVSHDRYLLDRLIGRLAELDRGDLATYDGNYSEYMVTRAERYAVAAKTDEKRQKSIAYELTWARKSAPARTTKQKARLQRLDELMANKPKAASGEVSFRLPHPPRIGKTILELSSLTKRFGDRTLIDHLDLIMKRGDRIGIVGPNGAGKTTLLRIILDELEPDAGEIIKGDNTVIVYADQARSDLNDEQTVLEAVAGDADTVRIGDTTISVHSFCEGLLFDGAAQRTKVAALSGGERSRVALAKSLRVAGNVLILDEPTNDLDLPTLRVLEEALVAYPGCALIVSHDRYFLDRVTTAILAFEGDGRIVLYEGSYTQFVERQAPAVESAAPKGDKKKGAPASKDAPRKLSFNEKRELAGIEEKIMHAEATVESLQAELNDPERLRELGAKVAGLIDRLEKQKKATDALYARWEVLSQRA